MTPQPNPNREIKLAGLRHWSGLIAGLIAAAASLALMSSPASAAFSHTTLEKEFLAGPGCTSIQDIAVVESTETIYVVCRFGPFETEAAIRRFDFEGNPVDFEASEPYITANEITESPTSPEGNLADARIAVDNSSAHHGFLYVAVGDLQQTVEAFAPTGKLAVSIPPPEIFTYGATPTDVDVGPSGALFVLGAGTGKFVGKVAEYNTSFHEVRRIYTFQDGRYVRIDSTGAAWIAISTDVQEAKISKYESDQWTTRLDVGFQTPEAEKKSVAASTSPLFVDPLLVETGAQTIPFDVDLTDDDLYVDRGDRIETYSHGTADEPPHQNAPAFGAGALAESKAVAVTADHRVFASSSGGKVLRFGPGDILPDVTTKVVAVGDIGHTSATVRGRVELAGGGDITRCTVEYVVPSEGTFEKECSPDPGQNPPGSNFTTDTDVSAELSGLKTGVPIQFRFRVGSGDKVNPEPGSKVEHENFGIWRTVTPAYVLKVQTLPATEITETGGILNGALDPDGIETTYRFEYGLTPSYGLATEEAPGGTVAGEVGVAAPVTGLSKGKLWHYRLVATNENGTTFGADQTFTTASAPDIGGVRATDVTATSAVFHARITPGGYDTTYRFEYGTTPAYGRSIPLSSLGIGSGTTPVDVSQRVEDLQAGITYHFRVVAQSKWGISTSPDTTLDFTPPSCPNDHVRQLTASSYLPDCRAYELVSPGTAGAVIFMPGEQVWVKSQPNWPQNTGLAISPSRFSFWGTLGPVAGLEGKVAGLEMYIGTRTPSGWVTTLPGHRTSESFSGARRQCSPSLDRCIEHDETLFSHEPADVFDVQGEMIDQWPTNLKAAPGGEESTGSQRASTDLSHFVFASTNAVFAPGGRTGGLGSVYDNNVADRTVALISTLPGGGDILQDGSDSSLQRFEFPAISADGTHILMRTPASGGRFHLYLRVNDAVTYDVANGAGVDFAGMTQNGSKVFFIASQQLTDDDNDAGDDLYMWSETGGEEHLIRISQGNGQGDANGCASTFSANCGVAALDTERDHPHDLPSAPGIDDPIAEGSGDVYFYSPESLDGAKPGIANQRNLYVYRDGAVQLVATLDLGTTINRMQISSDGSHAGLVTASRLTSYDNKGFKAMYVYDADTGKIQCASCKPTGVAPESNVEASSNGRFMSDDGRAFFATHDSLVPRDTDGSIIDVYEYVGGRPQLISSGLGSRDSTGGGKTTNALFEAVNVGLESVSRNGTDVFFSTYETLVSQDENGQFVKFYDARTGGGFADGRVIAPCVAADECHGPDSSPPPGGVIASGGSLGTGGNVQTQRKAKHKKKAKRNRKNHHHARKRHG